MLYKICSKVQGTKREQYIKIRTVVRIPIYCLCFVPWNLERISYNAYVLIIAQNWEFVYTVYVLIVGLYCDFM